MENNQNMFQAVFICFCCHLTSTIHHYYYSKSLPKILEGDTMCFLRLDVHYIASNSSILCFVLPCRICRSVLYLSRPALMFSLCNKSLWVFLLSSRAWDNSDVKACNGDWIDKTKKLNKNFKGQHTVLRGSALVQIT